MDSDFAHPWGVLANWIRTQEELAAANGAGCRPIQMIIGPSADAAAAARSLAEILNCRGRALFNQTPLRSCQELASVVATFQESGDDNCFLMVGCGGDIDLTNASLFDFTVSQVHVIHNVRPFHLSNLRSKDLHIWDQSDIEESVDTFFALHAPSVKKRDRHQEGDHDDEDQGRVSSRVDWRRPESLIHLQEVEKLYYATHGMGRGVAETLYHLSLHLQFTGNLYLWNCAVGLADLYIRNMLERSEYDHRLQNIELALQSNQLLHSRALGAFGRDSTNTAGTSLPFGVKPPPPQLVKGEEHRPLLLRHWTLWNALWHEPIIAAKLGAHNRQVGENNLKDLLAECGIHTEGEAKKPWANLQVSRRERILEVLLPLLGELIGNEHSLTLPCICRNKGHPETSTFDIVRLFTATVSQPLDQASVQKDGVALSKEQFHSLVVEHRRRQFWTGYDLLWDKESSRREGTPFCSALNTATNLQTTVSEATDAILSTSNKGVLSFQTSIQVRLTDGFHQSALGDPSRLQLLGAQVLAAEAEKTRITEAGRSSKYRTPKGRPLFLRCLVPNMQGSAQEDTFATTASATSSTSANGGSYYVVYFNTKKFGKTEPVKAIRELLNTASQYNSTYAKPVDPVRPELGVIPVVEQDELLGNRHIMVVKGEDISQKFTEQVYLNLQMSLKKTRHL